MVSICSWVYVVLEDIVVGDLMLDMYSWGGMSIHVYPMDTYVLQTLISESCCYDKCLQEQEEQEELEYN